MKKYLKTKTILAFLVGFLLIGFGVLFVDYGKTRSELAKLKKEKGKALLDENRELVNKVGKLIVLPNETPTIAVVRDLAKLKDQAFFTQAKERDKVLVFMNAKKAILYDPVANIIIDVAPVSIPTPSPEATSTAKISPTPTSKPTVIISKKAYKVALYNGTQIVGLTKKYEPELLNLLTEIEVVDKDDALEDYKESVLVNLSDIEQEEFEALSDLLKIKTGSLPKGESKPKGADLLIILGDDMADL